MGENRNAIVIQILVAIITYVLLTLHPRLFQHKSRLKDLFITVVPCPFRPTRIPAKTTTAAA